MENNAIKKRSLIRRIMNGRSISETVVHAIVFMLFLALSISYLFILVWCFIAGLRTHTEVTLKPFDIDWSKLYFKNYIEVFSRLRVNQTDFFGMVANSLYFSICGQFLNIFTAVSFAYVTTKYRFPGSKAVYFVVFAMMIIPIYGTGGSIYKLMYDMGITNNYTFIITACSGAGMNYMYFHSFFRGLSNSYSEAAKIDGANDWQIYFQVVLPQTVALAGSLFLMAWISDWNGYGGYLIYLPRIPVLSVGIYLFNVNMKYEVSMHILFAACFISVIPPLALFVSFSNIILNNVSLGGIKE
ncbi:MAG: carbohydrate ABC transporter permease [Clostridia bacterium]|nr:carbohydrate ABC transporter permease [Clostridia bacterium]